MFAGIIKEIRNQFNFLMKNFKKNKMKITISLNPSQIVLTLRRKKDKIG
jgi:hypothetical protein